MREFYVVVFEADETLMQRENLYALNLVHSERCDYEELPGAWSRASEIQIGKYGRMLYTIIVPPTLPVLEDSAEKAQ